MDSDILADIGGGMGDNRQAAKDLVDRYLDWWYSTDRDAGWRGDGILGRLVDFKGELPDSSGFYGVDRIFNSQKYLAAYVSIETRRAIDIMQQLHDRNVNHMVAILVDRAYRNRTKNAIDPFQPDKPIAIVYDDSRIADDMGIKVKTFHQWITRGYQFIEAFVQEKAA